MENKELEPKLQKVVAAVIFSDERRSVLVGQRAYDKPFPGKWEFIGGKVEEGERLEDAVKRETREETALRVEPLSSLGEAIFKTPTVSIDVTFFECEVKRGNIGNLNNLLPDREHSSFDWVDMEDLERLDWVGANGEFAKWLVEYNKNRFRDIFVEA